MRISNKKVRAIAYPGLILRYITPELVRQVLQPTLKLKPISEKESIEIVNELKKYGWLAYIGENQGLWHRKDLRRSMLQIMISQETEKTKALRLAAIEYFTQQKTTEADGECLYHQLMEVYKPQQGNSFDLLDLKKTYGYIYKDLADLPDSARALLQYAAGKKIDNNDIYKLPKVHFKKAYHDVGKALLNKRNFDDAYKLYKKGKTLNIIPPEIKTEELLSNWEAETLFCLGKWKELSLLEPLYFTGARITLLSLSNYLFPHSLVNHKKINPILMEEMLNKISVKGNIFDVGTLRSNQSVILSRLSVCLTILWNKKTLSQNSIDSIKKITQQINKKGQTPIVQKSLLLLQLIGTGKVSETFTPGISFLRLDAEWLLHLQSLLKGKYIDLINYTLTFINSSPDIYTSRQFLAKLYGDLNKEKQWHEVKVQLQGMSRKDLFELLRGPDFIFRDPCQQVLQNEFHSIKDIEILVRIMQRIIPFPLRDLNSQAIQLVIKDSPQSVLESFIEIVDRCWSLDILLKFAYKEKPITSLSYLLNSLNNWHRALADLIINSSLNRKL